MLHSDSGAELQLLSAQFIQVRQASVAIVRPLSEEDMQIQSMPEASPSKWHLAHTSWAFETFVLKPYLDSYEPYDPQYEYLFNSYYNAIGEQYPRSQRGLLSRPGFQEIMRYRSHVDSAMSELFSDLTIDGNQALLDLISLTINHEQQHQELMLTDLKHAFFNNPSYPKYVESSPRIYNPSQLSWSAFPEGLYKIGHNNESFYFDNEGPQHQIYLQPFQISSRLVTAGEYIQFIDNGGYQEPSFWLSEAWSKINEQNIKAPFYWVKKNKRWYQFTLSGLQPIDLNSPVMHVNYFEASAFANSVGKRLPTEQEWEVAAKQVEVNGTFFDHKYMHPCSAKGNSLEQMFGELWQWTSSSYNAYPGFKIPNGAIGEYNGKFMVNQYVLRGGSIATPRGHIRASYRNFFYPDASWQFSGIRLAESL